MNHRNSLLLLGTAWLLLAGISALAAKPAPAKQYIFSRSANQTSSSYLGLSGVPAYVNFPDGSQKRGVYVTRVSAGATALSMGLRPGTVLVSVDNRVVESPATADSLFSGRSGSMDYSYVKMVGGLPRLIQSKTTAGGSQRLGMAPPVVEAGPFTPMPDKRISDNTPLGTLESYMVSLINRDRSANGGLPALSDNSKLADIARHHAEYLLATGKLDHYDGNGKSPLDRARAAGIGGSITENLSLQPRGGNPEKTLVAAAEGQMLAEPANNPNNHRGHILWADGKAVGVGMARNAKVLIMVQDYADNSP